MTNTCQGAQSLETRGIPMRTILDYHLYPAYTVAKQLLVSHKLKRITRQLRQAYQTSGKTPNK